MHARINLRGSCVLEFFTPERTSHARGERREASPGTALDTVANGLVATTSKTVLLKEVRRNLFRNVSVRHSNTVTSDYKLMSLRLPPFLPAVVASASVDNNRSSLTNRAGTPFHRRAITNRSTTTTSNPPNEHRHTVDTAALRIPTQ